MGQWEVQLGNTKGGRGRAVVYENGRSRQLSVREFKGRLKRGFTMVVLTRVGRLRERSQ